MKDKKVGDISELRVGAKILECGYAVSEPLSDEKYDLIAEKDGEFIRVQVKHGRIKNGCVRATLCEYNRDDKYVYDDSDIDMFAIYNEDYGCFFITLEEAPEQLIHIRVEEPKQHKKTMNYGENYRAEEQL